MRTRTVVERIGENLGPIDWSYNFRQHFDCHCTTDANKDAYCAKAVELLRQIAGGGEWQVGYDHCFGMYDVLEVGMYDGWPFWRPVPSFSIWNVLGIEWHPFYVLQTARLKPLVAPTAKAEGRS